MRRVGLTQRRYATCWKLMICMYVYKTRAATHDVSSAVCSLYTDLSAFELEAELDILRQRKPEFKTYRDLFDWIKESQRHLLFRQLFNIAKLILLMPLKNATSGRYFSAMGRLKTCLRSSMGQERLNSLLMLHIHREMSMSLPIKEVIEQFVSFHPNRLKKLDRTQLKIELDRM